MKTKDGRPIAGKKELREWLTNHVENDFESAKKLFSNDEDVWKKESIRVQRLFKKKFSPAAGQHVTVLVVMDHYKTKRQIRSKISAWSKALRDRFDEVRARVIADSGMSVARAVQPVQETGAEPPDDAAVKMLPPIQYFQYISRALAGDENIARTVLCSNPDPEMCKILQNMSDKTNGKGFGGSAALLSHVFSEFYKWDGDENNNLAYVFHEFNRVLNNFRHRKTRVLQVPPPIMAPAEETETDDMHSRSIEDFECPAREVAVQPVQPVQEVQPQTVQTAQPDLGASTDDSVEFVIDDNLMFLQPSKRGYIVDWAARTVRAGVNPKRVRYANGDE